MLQRTLLRSVTSRFSRTVARPLLVRSYAKNEPAHDQLDEEEKQLGAHYKLTEEQKFRNKFLHFKKEHSHDYLGAKLAPAGRSDIEERAKAESEFYNSFFLAPNVPKTLSANGADLWSRIEYNWDYISKVAWNRMSDVEKYEEWQAIQKQYTQANLNESDKAIVDAKYQKLNLYWQLALRVENLASILDELVHKYQNTFSFPAEDEALVCKITDEYVELAAKHEGNHLLQSKLVSILEELTFLKQKVVLPALTVRYPTLFK